MSRPALAFARLQHIANCLEAWMDRHRPLALAVIFTACFLIEIPWAQATPLWFDELSTYYIVGQSTFHDQWAALTTIDNQPPLFFWVTTAAARLIANPHIGLRLPQMFGYSLLSVCVFLFTSRRTTALWGLVAVVSVFVTPAFHYGHEARPYALTTGCAALALVCWQSAIRGTWSRLSLAGLAFALAAAISLNYYAVLVILPLAVGELVRSFYRRSVDWSVWAALLGGSAFAFLYVPLVLGNLHTFSPISWASPRPTTVWELYSNLAGNLFLTGVLVLLAAVAKRTWMPPDPEPSDIGPEQTFPWEVAASIGFAVLPFFGFIAAVSVTKMIHFRYVLSTVVGLATLVPLVLSRRTRSSALSAVVMLCSLAVISVFSRAEEYGDDIRLRNSIQTVLPGMLAGRPERIPIVVDDPHRYLELFHYQSPDLASRLVYLVSDDASRQFGSMPYPEAKVWVAMKRFIPIRVEKLETFRQSTREYLLYSTGSSFAYVLPKLASGGARIRLIATHGAECLYSDTRNSPGDRTSRFLEWKKTTFEHDATSEGGESVSLHKIDPRSFALIRGQ